MREPDGRPWLWPAGTMCDGTQRRRQRSSPPPPSSEINTNGSQLRFNTHNPIYLNHNLLCRDEIKFVERDRETKSSALDALSDFKANGEASVRRTSDYMKNYFINRYGAIEDIDFMDIISDLLRGEAANEQK